MVSPSLHLQPIRAFDVEQGAFVGPKEAFQVYFKILFTCEYRTRYAHILHMQINLRSKYRYKSIKSIPSIKKYVLYECRLLFRDFQNTRRNTITSFRLLFFDVMVC